jgi:membrane protease subunit (stomatin/prohibitin family)
LKTAFTGGISTFNCVVYFVKTAHTTEIKWGTKMPIEVRDRVRRITVKVRGFGAFRAQVQNPAKFLEKMIGNNYYSATADGLRQFFDNEFQAKICSAIAMALNDSNQEIEGIAYRQAELSETIQPMIQSSLEPYGLRCVSFSIARLSVDGGERAERYDNINMDAYAKVANAQADRAVMDTLGNQWAQQQSFDLMNNMAKAQANGAQNPMMNATMGFGMGAAAGNMFGAMAQQTFAPAQQAPAQQAAPAAEDPMEVLAKLKRMLDAGLIEQAEYDAKKAEILSRM